MLKLRRATCLLLLTVTFSFAHSATNPLELPETLDTSLLDVFHSAFNLKFDEAKQKLSGLKNYSVAHPMVALAGVVTAWWDLSVHVLESDAQASEEFLNRSEEAMELAERLISRGDKKGEGDLVLGTTLGLLSRWSATNRAWIPAYMRGSRSSRYAERALKKNPKLVDAYMTIGTFNYASELLRTRITSLDTNAVKKNTGLGTRQLTKAMQEGYYFKDASSLMLAGLLTNENPEAALPILEKLRLTMPENGFVHMVYLTALYNAGSMDELQTEVAQFKINIDTGTYKPWFMVQYQFVEGLISLRKHDWKIAADHFDEALDLGEESNPYFTWAHLYQGYAYDALGERRKAKKMYEKTLRLRRRFASHDHARERLSRPFSPSDIELTKLEL